MQSLAAVLKLVADPARRVPPPVQAAKPRIQVWLLKKAVVLIRTIGSTPLLNNFKYVIVYVYLILHMFY